MPSQHPRAIWREDPDLIKAKAESLRQKAIEDLNIAMEGCKMVGTHFDSCNDRHQQMKPWLHEEFVKYDTLIFKQTGHHFEDDSEISAFYADKRNHYNRDDFNDNQLNMPRNDNRTWTRTRNKSAIGGDPSAQDVTMQGQPRSRSISNVINISEGDFPMRESASDPMLKKLQSIKDLLKKSASMTHGHELSTHAEILSKLNQCMSSQFPKNVFDPLKSR